MQYALLIYEDESVYGGEKQGPKLQAIVGQHMELTKSLGSRWIGGCGLAGTETATTIRTSSGGKAVHDGPFAETKEQLGGFYLIDVRDLDAAIVIARQVPLLGQGHIEIRPVLGG